tara:strand:- start:38100 stop:39002 length:903 start_codon:yes stop_codon:yes gene_type:complete
MPENIGFTYGGQAVIEGVMIRGKNNFSVAVRAPNNTIPTRSQALPKLFTGPARKVPILRGMIILLEALVIGVTALNISAQLAVENDINSSEDEMPTWLLATTVAFSLCFGIGLFFVLPLLIVHLIDPWISSSLASNIIEGIIRLLILLAYISAIGLIKDIKRVFAYHGAEHMAVHAHEASLPLNVVNVRKFGTPHPRCGTAFLLTVVLVSIIVFAFLGRPDLEWRILSRLLLIPVVAGISYELIRFSGTHQSWGISKIISGPGLLLQRLTTRQPDDQQIEVAIAALHTAMKADETEPDER